MENIENKGNQNTESDLLTEKARETAHDIVDRVASSSADLEKKVKNYSRTAEGKVNDMVASGQAVGKDYVEKTTRYIQENPLRSLGIALVAGYLVSSLTNRR